MPYIEHRGGSIRVKWWNGGYKLDADRAPTKTKLFDSASGPEPGVKFADEEEAWNFGLDREQEVRHGKYILRADGKTLMEPYCWRWHEALDLRQTSTRRYASILRAQIIPRWGRDAVGDITAWEYEAWRKDLKAAVKAGRLSEAYVKDILVLFGMLMTDAVAKYKLRTETPVVTQRRRGRYVKKAREKKRPFEMETLHQLATNAYTVWGYTGWTCMWTIAFTGMRPPGEVFGLRREFASPTWPASDPRDDPDEEGRYKDDARRYGVGAGLTPALRVQYQVQYEDGRRVLVSPKYDSHRTLVLPPFLHEMHVALLASHQSPWVFPALDGAQMSTQWNQVYWKFIRGGSPERTGYFARPEIPPVADMVGKRLYLLRHWQKEMLEEDGHPRVAQETRMGHEVAGVEGLYGNLTPQMEKNIASALQARWEKFMGDDRVWQPAFPKPFPVDLQRDD